MPAALPQWPPRRGRLARERLECGPCGSRAQRDIARRRTPRTRESPRRSRRCGSDMRSRCYRSDGLRAGQRARNAQFATRGRSRQVCWTWLGARIAELTLESAQLRATGGRMLRCQRRDALQWSARFRGLLENGHRGIDRIGTAHRVPPALGVDPYDEVSAGVGRRQRAVGATARQGPHHGAQKSTTTGTGDENKRRNTASAT